MARAKGSLVRCRCCVCGKVELARGASHRCRCEECRTQGRRLPTQEDRWLGNGHAQMLVARAVREGQLRPARDLTCVDCGGAAIEYEHRDYNRPLDVEPICRGCNLRRGPAIPLTGSVERLIRQGKVPYRSVRAARLLCITMGRPGLADDMPKRMDVEHWKVLWPRLIDGPCA
jgi:hypothetical protein